MYKKAISYCIAGILTLCFIVGSSPVYAVEEDAFDEDSTLEIVTYDYQSKTEEITTLDRQSFQNDLSSKMEKNALSEEKISQAYNPGLVDAKDLPQSRSIIGADNQVRVNPNVFPYSAVLSLRLGQDTNGDGRADSWGLGTGFLEGYDVMATAGHCFWSAKYGWVEECRIFTRHNSSTWGSKFYYPQKWTCSTKYTQKTDINYDWCAVTLQDNLGSANGWFGKGWSNGSIAGKQVTISGYPAETPSKVGFQYTHSGPISSSNEYRANYSIDTEGGNSGSPVYDSRGIVWAIHTHGGNSGSRITSWLYEILQNKFIEGKNKWG